MFLLRKVDFYTVNSVVENLRLSHFQAMWIFFNLLLFLCVIAPNEPIKTSELFVNVSTFLSLRSYLSFSTASALPSTRQRHKKMSALLQSHQGSHEIDLVLGLRAQKKRQSIRVHLLYGWQERR